jgi:uncharacterized integral membrane protein
MAHDDQQPSTSHQAKLGAGDILRILPAAILVVLLVIFAAVNTDQTKVNLLFATKTLPLWIVLLVTAVVGAIIAALVKFKRNH